MQPLDDYPIGTGGSVTPPPVPPSRGNLWRVWAVAGLVGLLIAFLATFMYLRRSRDAASSAGAAGEAATQQGSPAREPLGPPVEARELPPLDLTDPIVRELLGALSSRPELAAWLASDGLIRRIVVSIDAVANGVTPTTQLQPLAPTRPFAVEARGEEFVIDPRSYQRYDGIADTVATIDADGLARAYSILRPRLQDAYRELGYPEGHVDDAVERAIVRLLRTPVPQQDLEVYPAPVLYKFSDERLERLAAAQKQLLRMGPRNVRLVQGKLRSVARALRIPAERLPQ